MITLFFHVLFILSNYLKKKKSEEINDKKMTDNAELLITTEKIKKNKDVVTEFDIENSFYDDNNYQIRFNPPLYIQRYCEVQKILTDDNFKGKLRKVVEFGCSELSFFLYLKNSTPQFEELVFVDIDRSVLEANKRKIETLSADYLHMRDRPLNVFVYEGSVASRDRRLLNTDAVVAIELIEHLYPETLAKVPEVIFGFMKPQVAVITTPNADFNVLFPNFSGSRHPDHKFEWSRSQFQTWCFQITAKYPNYSVTFSGVGEGPPGSEHLGPCSQMAIFTLTNFVPVEVALESDLEDVFQLVAEEHYPVHIDNRSDEDKIVDEASYYLRSFHLNNDEDEMPLERLAEIMETRPETLKDVLETAGWEVLERDPGTWFVVCRPLSIVSEYDADENLDWDMDVGDDVDATSWRIDSGKHWESEDWKPGPGPRCDWQPIPGANHQEAASPKMTLDLETDSGYPYTSSMPDVTPESELPSIADDLEEAAPRIPEIHIEVPVQVLVPVQVENGDLVNNNRDGEGNNVVAEEREAEGDLENENIF